MEPLRTNPLLFLGGSRPQDMALGRFLEDKCFQDPLKCDSPNCKKSVRDHLRSFVHNNGRVDITVRSFPFRLSDVIQASASESPPTAAFMTATALLPSR